MRGAILKTSCLVGLDIGSSGAKAGVFDAAGRLVAAAAAEYRFERSAAGVSEIDPELVWRCAVTAVRQAMTRSRRQPAEVAGLGLSVIGETVMALDKSGSPLCRAIEAVDARENGYHSQLEWWRRSFGAESVFLRTSYPLSSLATAVKIRWLLERAPEIARRTALFATFQDFLLLRTTGKAAIDHTMASRTMLFDVQRKTWVDEYLEALGLTPACLSTPCASTTVVGGLLEGVASAMGLAPGTPVVAGAHDQACAALSAGAVREGVALDGTGSVEAIVVPLSRPIREVAMLERGHGSQCHAVPDLYLGIGFHLASGAMVRWYRDQMWRGAGDGRSRASILSFDRLAEAAARSVPGARGLILLPHISGAGTGRFPPLDPASRGALLGLTSGHTSDDAARAVFEGVCYEARLVLESLEQSGLSVAELVVSGGATKSPFWLQLKADILGRRVVTTDVVDGSIAGAAMLAGLGLGLIEDVDRAVLRFCRRTRVYEPVTHHRARYDAHYTIYRDVYPAVIGIHERLGKRETTAE